MVATNIALLRIESNENQGKVATSAKTEIGYEWRLTIIIRYMESRNCVRKKRGTRGNLYVEGALDQIPSL